MADQRNGGIAWTETTWNPLRGCSRVSEGCRHCYAESVAGRFSGPGQPYDGLVTIGEKGPRWNGTVRFVPEKLAEPISWRKPRRVFVNSMSDLFHESVPFEQIAAIFGVMAASPRHTFQVLTKRPERARDWFRWVDREAPIGVPSDPDSPWWRAFHCFMSAFNAGKGTDNAVALAEAQRLLSTDKISGATWPLQNVWLGVSVEDQRTADARIPLLLETPAAVRWVSYEPAIGPVDFRAIPYRGDADYFLDTLEGRYSTTPHGHGSIFAHGMGGKRPLDWIVVGGESGHGARLFDLAWARSVIAQTRGTGCRVFVKQLGARPTLDGQPHCYSALPPFGGDAGPITYRKIEDRKGGDPNEWPEDLRVREWPEVSRG